MTEQHAIHCQKVYTDETVCEECELYSTCTHETQADIARIAIAALEKQIPNKPVKICTGARRCYFTCPTCKQRQYSHEKHCCDCGQKLDWSD